MAAISVADRNRIFGQPGQVVRVTVLTPWGIHTQVHVEVDEVFLEACGAAEKASTWRPKRIDGFNPRPIRGTTGTWSMHAYALAHDFFATPPGVAPPGGVWTPANACPPEFRRCFTDRGFRAGADFKRVDEPHIEWPAGLPSKRKTPIVTPPTEEDIVQVSICAHPNPKVDRLDWVVIGSDGHSWHGWGTSDDIDQSGILRLAPNFQLRDDSAPSCTWSADQQRFTVAGVGTDDHVWSLTWHEQVGREGDSNYQPGYWAEPVQSAGVVGR